MNEGVFAHEDVFQLWNTLFNCLAGTALGGRHLEVAIDITGASRLVGRSCVSTQPELESVHCLPVNVVQAKPFLIHFLRPFYQRCNRTDSRTSRCLSSGLQVSFVIPRAPLRPILLENILRGRKGGSYDSCS
jgi:hypothetical protein